jgi:hypothetical protein
MRKFRKMRTFLGVCCVGCPMPSDFSCRASVFPQEVSPLFGLVCSLSKYLKRVGPVSFYPQCILGSAWSLPVPVAPRVGLLTSPAASHMLMGIVRRLGCIFSPAPSRVGLVLPLPVPFRVGLVSSHSLTLPEGRPCPPTT